MKGLWSVVLVVAVVASSFVGVGCKGRTADDEAPVEQEIAAEMDLRRDLELLEGTRAVLKVHPEGLFEALQYWEFGGIVARGEDAREVMSVLLGKLFAGDRWKAPGKPGLEGLSLEEPSYVALSWGGNQRFIDNLRYGVFMGFDEARMYPWQVRVFLRSERPESLAGELQSYCQGRGDVRDCVTVDEVSWNGGFVLVDLELFDFGWPEELAPPEWTRSEERGEDFLDWESPAGQAFEGSQAPWTVYRRAETMSELATLSIVQGLPLTLLDSRASLRDEVARLELYHAANVLLMESPEAREFEDVADLMSVVDGALVIESVMSHTERGAEIYRAARRSVAVPRVEVQNPQVRFAWSGDLDAGSGAAEVPEWMKEARSGGMLEVAERYGGSGAFGYQMGLWEYPWGAVKGLRALAAEAGDLWAVVVENLHGLIGARGALIVTPRPRGGVEVEGGIALVFDGAVRDEDEVFDTMQEIPWGPVMGTFEMRFSVTTLGDDVVLQIGPGDHNTLFGEAEVVESTSVSAALEAIMGPGGFWESVGRIQVDQQARESGMLRRFVFGAAVEADPLTDVPERVGPPVVPVQRSDCFRDYVRAAREARTAIGRHGPLEAHWQALDQALSEIRAGCAGTTADEERWMERIDESWQD